LVRKLKLRRDVPRASHLTFLVYTRQQCCCCHKALDVLEAASKLHGFTIETIDVDSDPGLVEKYGEWVPVVLVDGKLRFRGKVEPVLLERLLAAEAARATSP
jgi:predicted thioredoxin/glutaredoxin